MTNNVQDSKLKVKVAQCLAGAQFGGAENFYTRLVCSLAKDPDIEQTAFTRANIHRVPKIEAAGVPVKTFRFGSGLHFFDNWRYRQALKRFDPDVVLTFMNRPSRLTPKGKYKLVCRLGHYYDLKNYRHADYWVGVSKGICKYLIEGGIPADRIVNIPNYVDEVDDPPLSRESYGTPKDVPLLLAAGRLHVNKGFDILFHGLKDIPDAVLWLAGDGPEKEALRELAKQLNIEHRIRFLGWRDDIIALMRSVDLFICPSRHEGLGSIVPESWYAECPIIATASQGPGELITHDKTGLLSPVDEVEPLRKNIQLAIDDSALRQRLIEAGVNEYQQFYSEKVIVKQYKDLFIKIASGKI